MIKKVPLHRLRQITKERSIRSPQLAEHAKPEQPEASGGANPHAPLAGLTRKPVR